jgi:hypothetical protein
MSPACPPIAMVRRTACVTKNTTKIGRIAFTDSLTPRMLSTVSKTIAPISITNLMRVIGSPQLPTSEPRKISPPGNKM